MEKRGDLFVFLVAVLILGVFAFLVGISITGNIIYNPEDYVKINSCLDLQNIKNNLSGNFILNKNINCIGTPFLPIGNDTNKFTGAFYGNGYTISNISIVGDSDNIGIFGYTDGATFSNFSLYNITVKSNAQEKNVGVFGNILNSNFSHINVSLVYVEGKNERVGFVGYSNGSNFLNIELDKVTINATLSYSEVGGLVAHFEKGVINNIKISNINIYGKKDVGGLVGYYDSPGKISSFIEILNSNISIKNSGSSSIGGLIGSMYSGEITNSSVMGGVINSSNSNSKDVGGLIGQLSNPAIISNSFSNITIQNSGNNTGGVIGTYDSISGKAITRLYSLGKITGEYYVGGVIGYLKGGGQVEESYSISNIVGKEYVGGIAGILKDGSSRIYSTYYNGTINGTENVGGLVGLNNGHIINSYSSGIFKRGGSAECSISSKIGGVAGSNNGNIENSYSTMDIIACNYVGGLVGYNEDAGKISYSFYTGSITNNKKTFVIGRVNGSTALGQITKLYYYNESTKGGYGCYANYTDSSSYGLIDDYCNSTKVLDNFTNYSFFGNNQYILSWNDRETWGYFIYDNMQLPKFYWQSQCFEDTHCMNYTKTSAFAKSCYNSFCINTTPELNISSESPQGDKKIVISESDTEFDLSINTLRLSKIGIDSNFGVGECEIFGGHCSNIFNFRDNFNEGLIYGFSFEDDYLNFLNGKNSDISLTNINYVDGRYGRSIYFYDKSEARMDSDTLNNFTIVFWLKPTSVDGTEVVLSRREQSLEYEDFSLKIKNVSSKINLSYYIGSEELSLQLSVNKWNFVAIDFNGTTSTLYVHNGTIGSKIVSSSKSGITRTVNPGNYKIFLGNEDLSNSSIDEFRLYNKSNVNVQDIFYMGLRQPDGSNWDWEYTFRKKLDVGTYNYKFSTANDVGQLINSKVFHFSVVNFLDGNGSIDNPFQIFNCENLKKVNEFLDSNFILLNDINCTGINYFGIGNDTHSFNATFNGNGYKIFGLNISNSENYTGLFRKLNDSANIYDLVIEDSVINGTKYVGCLYGYSSNKSVVKDVTCRNVTVIGNDYTGGFAGYSNSSSTNIRVLFSKVIGANNTGGLFGYSGNIVKGSRVEDSVVNGTNYIGGAIGVNNGTVSSTFVSNTILNNTLSKNNVSGGIVGLNKGILTDSFFSGEVRGVFDVGGLVGINNGTIFNSYSNASIFCQPCAGSDKMINSGGIAGTSYGNIYNIFSVSYVNAGTTCDDSNLCAGLVGFNNGTISNSYWLNDTSGEGKEKYLNSYCNASGSCMSSDYIKIKEDINYFLNYTNAPMNHTLSGGWDFNNTWSYYNSGLSLPLLKHAFECVNNSHCLDSEHCVSGVCVNTVPKISLDPLHSTGEGAKLNLSSINPSIFTVLININSSKLGKVNVIIGNFNVTQDLFGSSSSYFDPKRVNHDLLDENLILGISFDNNSIDNFLNSSYNGTNNNSVFVSNGKYGGARSFNGINSSINFSSKNILYYDNFSVFTWVNWEKGNKMPIIGDESEKWLMGINESGSVYYKIGNDYFYSNGSIVSGKWNFVGVLLEEETIHFYINGEEINSIENKEVSEYLGGESIPIVGKFDGNYANGTIDEILLFNKTLNSTEISMLYTSRLSWDGDDGYLLALAGNELNYITIPDGKQTLKITACNDRGACSLLTRNFIIETESVYTAPSGGSSGDSGSSGGSSSGGGDSYEPGKNVYSISEEQLSKGYNVDLRVEDKFYFSRSNKSYHFTLIENANNSTQLRLTVPYKIFNFSLSEEKLIDLTDNGYSDISIKLSSTNSTHASFLVKYSSVLINPPNTNNGSSGGKENHTSPEPNGDSRPTDSKGENPNKNSSSLFTIIGILLGVIILAVVAVIVISIRKKKVEEERKKNTQKLPLGGGPSANVGGFKKPMPSPGAPGMKTNIPLPQGRILKGQKMMNVPQNKNIMPPVNKIETPLVANKPQVNDLNVIKDINILILKANALINQGNLPEAKLIYKQLNEKYSSLSKHNENIYKKILELYENFKK